MRDDVTGQKGASGSSIYYCSFLGNEGNGIEIESDVIGLPLFLSTNYIGNDTDLDGDWNLFCHQVFCTLLLWLPVDNHASCMFNDNKQIAKTIN